MNDLIIPDKCEECGKRKPNKVIFDSAMDRSMKIYQYAKFICNKCDAVEKEGEQ